MQLDETKRDGKSFRGRDRASSSGMQPSWTSSGGAPIELWFRGTAPIPLGHEVELVAYEKLKLGVFSVEEKWEVLTDLVTGVIYMPFFQGPLAPWEQPDVIVERRVRGRVVRCEVQTMLHTDGTVATRLLVDQGPRPAYR